MRKFVVCTLMSLDGYFEGEGKNFMVMPADHSFDAYCAERLRTADTLLLGRATFELFHGFWPAVADNPGASADQREISKRDNELQKVVVSDTLTLQPGTPWVTSTRVVSRAEAVDTVRDLKAEPGGDILTFGSRHLWNGLLAAGLVDELHLMVGPAVLGGGTPVFGSAPVAGLRRMGVQTFDGSDNVVLRYAVDADQS